MGDIRDLDLVTPPVTTYTHVVTPAAIWRVPGPDREAPAVVFDRVSLAFDDHVVLDEVSFSLPKGSMRILLGASGAGKSVVLKLILGLLKPDSGAVEVNGERVDVMGERDLLRIRSRIGMVFQENALFDSLSVDENVGFQMYEAARLPVRQVQERVDDVLSFIGLADYADRLPAELSGGQRRRVAIARAMAPRPELLLFDDPITGLDPIIATTVDDEIIKLRDLERVTALLVTHQIRDAFYIATHEAVRANNLVSIVPAAPGRARDVSFMLLHEGRIRFEGGPEQLIASRDKYVRDYLYKTRPPW